MACRGDVGEETRNAANRQPHRKTVRGSVRLVLVELACGCGEPPAASAVVWTFAVTHSRLAARLGHALPVTGASLDDERLGHFAQPDPNGTIQLQR